MQRTQCNALMCFKDLTGMRDHAGLEIVADNTKRNSCLLHLRMDMLIVDMCIHRLCLEFVWGKEKVHLILAPV